MIAHVIPVTRLPAHMHFFDYLVPQGMEVNLGDLVSISLRGVTLRGIVRDVDETSVHRKLSTLQSVLQKNILSQEDITRIETLAQHIGQSPANILHVALPKFGTVSSSQKTAPSSPPHHSPKISQHELPVLQELLKEIENNQTKPHALQGDFETGIALAYLLTKRLQPHEQILILVPRDHDAHGAAQALGLKNIGVLTGTTNERERGALFASWHAGTLQTLICTKQGALWSGHTLRMIIVLHAGNDEYANLRRNPKFDPREAAKLLAEQTKAAYVSVDTLPRVEDAGEGSWLTPYTLPEPLFVSLKNREEKTPHPLLTASLLEAIKSASQSQKRVLLFLNRKKAAKRIQCKACGQVPLCGTCGNLPTVRANDLLCERCGTEMWIPETCPLCGKPKLTLVGVGGEKVAFDLQELFPELSVHTVEKDNDHAWLTANIVIATEHVFANLISPFVRSHFGLVADLMADLPVSGVNFRATEHTSRQLLRLLFFAKREQASCIIQTWLPDRLPSLVAPTFVLEEELRIRRAYMLPPFGKLFTTSTATLRNPNAIPNEPFIYDGSYQC